MPDANSSNKAAVNEPNAKYLRANEVSVEHMAPNPTYTLTQRAKLITVADNRIKEISVVASIASCDRNRRSLRIDSMNTPPENEKTQNADATSRPLLPMREPLGRLGDIVRRLKQMAPPPAPRVVAATADSDEK
ncbi:MAG TPA: hypothetical protein VN723_11420 [Rhizomicrobium sp.]|nr:hypothetical protein [Rhizomicrobium sp.]